MRKGAMLDLVLISEEWLVSNVKLKGSLGCRPQNGRIQNPSGIRGWVASLLLWTSGEQTLNSSENCLAGRHGRKPWREEGPKKARRYSRTISSKPIGGSQEKGRQARMLGGLCRSTRSSWTYFSSKRKSVGSGRKNRLPGRTTKKLSKQSGIRLGVLKPRQI